MKRMLWTRTYADDDLRCSFCRRTESEVGELICSPSKPLRYICASCVDVCNGLLKDRGEKAPEESGRQCAVIEDNHGPLTPGRVITVKYSRRGKEQPGSK
jgi:hypothetical protein